MRICYLAAFGVLQHSPLWIQEGVAGDGAHPGAGGYAALAELVQHWSAWANWLSVDAEIRSEAL